MQKSELWCDKYAPQSLNAVLSQSKAIKDIRVWANEWIQHKTAKPLLFVGPSGTGKTLTAHLVAKEYGWQLIESNASDIRTRGMIDKLVGDTNGVFSLTGTYRLFLIDEADGLSSSDKGGASALASILRKPKTPIILTANDAYATSLRTIRGLCTVIKFNKVNYLSLTKHLEYICEKEGLQYDIAALKVLAKKAAGDVRAAVMDLQNIAGLSPHITVDLVDKLDPRDTPDTIFTVLKVIFKTLHFHHALDAAKTLDNSVDIGSFEGWIDENLPYEYEYPDDLAKAYMWVSKANLYKNQVVRRQHYEFWKYARTLLSTGVALSKTEPYRKFFVYKPPSSFLLLARTRTSRTLDHKLAEKISVRCHVSIKQAIFQYLPILRLLSENRLLFIQIIAQFLLSESDTTLRDTLIQHLSSKKLSEKEIKSLIHDAELLRAKSMSMPREGVSVSKPPSKKMKDDKQMKLFAFA